MNILNLEQLENELEDSFKSYNIMIIQEQVEWNEVRVLVVKWEIILAINRIPPFVIWDGKHTIKQLIDIENKTNPLRGNWYENKLSYIKVDDETTKMLKQYGYTLESIPKKWEKVFVRLNSNLATGGNMLNITDILHHETKQLCIDITKKLGFWICGVDIMVKDFTKPIKNNVKILELNATPWIWWDKELAWVNSVRKMLEILFK